MDFITYEQEGFVGVITINRPKALNALNSGVLDELNACLDAVDLEATRALILTGAGEKSFVAGADIAEMSTLTKAEGEAFGKKGNDVFRKLETFPIPVIAAVNGFALGGGCEIAMSCDIRICSDNALFGQPEVGLGITPGFGGTQRLARLIGAGKAKEMIYACVNVKAEEAKAIGLVNAVYTQEELLPAAKKLAGKIAKNAPIAVRACKKAINDGLDAPMDEAIVIEERLFGSCFEKAKEMIYACTNVKAEEAKALGLVNAVYTQEELLPAAKKLAGKIAKNAPIAVRACKKAINDGLDAPMDEAIVIEEKLFGSCFETEDQREGMGAFLEKRKVEGFKNR